MGTAAPQPSSRSRSGQAAMPGSQGTVSGLQSLSSTAPHGTQPSQQAVSALPANQSSLSSVGSISSDSVHERRREIGRAINEQREIYWQNRGGQIFPAQPQPMDNSTPTPPVSSTSNAMASHSAQYILPSRYNRGYYVPEWSTWVSHTPSFSDPRGSDGRGTFSREYESPLTSASQNMLEANLAYSQAHMQSLVEDSMAPPQYPWGVVSMAAMRPM